LCFMKHPEREEWIPFIFGEADAGRKRQLESHLDDCAECREEIQSWQRSLGRLDSWKLPPVAKRPTSFAPLMKWAAAAAVVLCVGFAMGRSSAHADAEKLRAAVERDLRGELAQIARDEAAKTASLAITAFSQKADTRRAADNRVIFSVLERVETQHATDCLTLKKELDTLAINADAGLRQTEEQLVQFADSSRPTIQP
jgi:Putative zinc-finger